MLRKTRKKKKDNETNRLFQASQKAALWMTGKEGWTWVKYKRNKWSCSSMGGREWDTDWGMGGKGGQTRAPGNLLIRRWWAERRREWRETYQIPPLYQLSSLSWSPRRQSPLAWHLNYPCVSSRRHTTGLCVWEIFVRPFALHLRTSLTLGDSIPPTHPQAQAQVNADGSMTEKILSIIQNVHESIRHNPPENLRWSN